MSDRSQFAHDMAAGLDFSGHPFRPVYQERQAVPVMPPREDDARASMIYWAARAHEAHVRLHYGLRYGWSDASLEREAVAMYHAAIYAATCYRHLPLRCVCAWCQLEMRAGRELTTHSMCASCLTDQLR